MHVAEGGVSVASVIGLEALPSGRLGVEFLLFYIERSQLRCLLDTSLGK